MRTIRTACTYDCPDACGLIAEVDGDRLTLRGDPEHPIAQGFTCLRIRKHPERLRAPERITRPLVRDGAGWREIGWDEAIDLAAERLSSALRSHGAPSVAYMTGGGSLGLSKELIGHFFRALGPVTTVRGGVCGEAGETAQSMDFGEAACHDYTDMERSAAVVLWGKNPAATGVHLVPFVKAARKRGAPVIVIDPLPMESTKLGNRVIPMTPGGDGFLALAVLRRLFDRNELDASAWERVENPKTIERILSVPEFTVDVCAHGAGLGLDDVDALAALYARTGPVATWIGWGLQRSGWGGRNLRWIDALCLLSGNVGVPGGGANFTSWRRRGLSLSMLAPATGRSVAAPSFGVDLEGLRDPAVRFLYVAAANPVTQFADSRSVERALRAVDFTVVVDAFFTDTARAADLVLPAALMLEENDVVGSYQHHHVAVVRKVMDPPPGVRTDLAIIREIGKRAGLPADPLLEEPDRALARMTAPWFGDGSEGPGRNPHQEPVPYAERFDTLSGKARLVTEPPDPIAQDPNYPLVFMTVASRRWQTSQLREGEQTGPAPCYVHPEAPGVRALAGAGRARIVSPIGSMEVTICMDARMRRDTCLVHRGGWLCRGRGVNALVEGRSTDLGEGTAFYDQRVRLEAVR